MHYLLTASQKMLFCGYEIFRQHALKIKQCRFLAVSLVNGVSGPRYAQSESLPHHLSLLSLTHSHTHKMRKCLKADLSVKRQRDGEKKSRRRGGESLGAGLCPGSPSLSGSQPSATAAAWL